MAAAGLVTLSLLALPPMRKANADPMPGWAWVRPVSVDNSGQASPLVAFPLHVTLQSPAFDFAEARADGADLRFTNAAGALLPYWIESWNPAGGSASVWVKADSLPAGTTATLYLLHGNPAATPAGDPHATFLFYDGFESKNAREPLVTPTDDGTGQAMHPDVVFIPGGWHGYEYWMGMTPYPYDQDGHENPSILASHDGLAWEVPAGLTNPIAPGFSGGYHNDTDLLFVNDTLVLFYLQTFASGTTALRRTESRDGVIWSAPVTVHTFTNYVMSPSVVIEDGVWKMWYVASAAGCSSSAQDVWLRTSPDGITWGAAVAGSFSSPDIVPWHLDVKRDGDRYVMLVACYAPTSNCEHTDLWYAESTDGLAWTYAPQPIIARSGGGWDNLEVYRSTFLVDAGRLRIWYSASSTAHVWGTAYVEGTLQDFLAATAAPWDDARGGMDNVAAPVRSGQFALQQSGGATYPQLAKQISGRVAVSAWLYDDLDATSEHAALLRLWDPGTPGQPLHSIGVGYLTDQSVTNYAYHTEGWTYFDAAPSRTAGWHLLTAAVADDACRLSIDGENVASLSVLDENAIGKFSLEGDAAGTHWFDDVYVRPYAEPEPVVTVQSAISTAGVDGGAAAAGQALRLETVHPNPMSARSNVTFSLARASEVTVRVLGVQGALVRTLANGAFGAGRHVLAWDGRDAHGRRAPSGIYFVQVRAAGETRSRRIVVLL